MFRNTLIIFFMILSNMAISQENADNRPVRKPFSSASFINTQTVIGLNKGEFEFNIQHRFADIHNGYSNLFGIFGSSNIRLDLRYGISKKISVGAGITKNKFLHDANIKIIILRQTRSGHIPLSLAYYGDIAAKSRVDEKFEKFVHRFSYSNSLIISRKINRLFSVGLSANHAHVNIVDTTVYKNIKHDNFGITGILKFRIKGNISFIAEYDFPISKVPEIKQNIGFGFDISTATHDFQIFASNYRAISSQYNMIYNTYDFSKGDFCIGFNISKRW